MLNVGFIGLSRHAGVHIDIISKCSFALPITYHPSSQLASTNRLSDLLDCEAIIVSSPSKTHELYFQYLIDNDYSGYIYLEKPGFTTLDGYHTLKKLGQDIKSRIRIGYHFPHTALISSLKKLLPDSGDLLYINLISSKPISRLPWFHNDWRSQDKYQITQTLLSHLISIYANLSPQPINLSTTKVSSFKDQSEYWSSAFATNTSDLPSFSALASWNCPVVNLDLTIVALNGIYKLKDSHLTIHHTSLDTDASGRLIQAPTTHHDLPKDISVTNYVLDFLSLAKQKTPLSVTEFDSNITVSKLCLDF